MTTSTDSSTATADTLRRQLILAQVQLMELEDTRDDLRSQLAAARDLLAQTQTLGDRALEDQDRMAADLRERQAAIATQQVAADSLRAELAAAREREADLAARLASRDDQLAERTRALADASTLASARQDRIAQLDTERHAMQASWSWRCTAPLRALGRFLHRGGSSV